MFGVCVYNASTVFWIVSRLHVDLCIVKPKNIHPLLYTYSHLFVTITVNLYIIKPKNIHPLTLTFAHTRVTCWTLRIDARTEKRAINAYSKSEANAPVTKKYKLRYFATIFPKILGYQLLFIFIKWPSLGT